MDVSNEWCCDESETETETSDESCDDPNFEVLEETRLNFSDLSIKKKPKIRIEKERDEGEDSDEIEAVVLELDEQSQKVYEAVQKIIEVGQVERLKVEQCKIYLRKHRLRLSGTKDTLIQRIKEHIEIVNGGGEKKYAASSFVVNCKGDACMGDVVMFEQNVYEMFNIASRSANGPPCGTRIVAGRIVKESYGASKQQHTFTIEVLWSKGEKPLPPLHQLLIKGRNLYKLKTMRQRWDNEEERQRILSEKHNRGGIARLNREARLQQKEMKKIQKQARLARDERPTRKHGEEKRRALQTINTYSSTCRNMPILQQNMQEPPYSIPKAQVAPPPQEWLPQRQPLLSKNHCFPRHQHTNLHFCNVDSSHFTDHGMLCQPQRFPDNDYPGYSQSHGAYHSGQNSNITRNLQVQQKGYTQKQVCRHYLQGRCYYGDRCKYLHESTWA